MGKQSTLDVYLKVLEVIDRGINRPIKILAYTKLPERALAKALSILTKGGFIQKEKDWVLMRYGATSKGKNAFSSLRDNTASPVFFY